jgi:hypothetical protein
MPNNAATKEGVAEAFDFWLSQHPLTIGDIIEEAISKSLTEWLNEHSDEVIEAIKEVNYAFCIGEATPPDGGSLHQPGDREETGHQS